LYFGAIALAITAATIGGVFAYKKYKNKGAEETPETPTTPVDDEYVEQDEDEYLEEEYNEVKEDDEKSNFVRQE
jgi:hypothetical protein